MFTDFVPSGASVPPVEMHSSDRWNRVRRRSQLNTVRASRPGVRLRQRARPPRIRAARGAGIAISHPQQLALRTASMARTTALAGMSFSQPSRTNSPSTMPSTDSGIVNRKNIDLDNRVRDFWAQQSPGQAPTRICTLVLAITSSPGLSLLESSLPGHPV
jgi:hypothetical protein